jgi:hypothetical protein
VKHLRQPAPFAIRHLDDGAFEPAALRPFLFEGGTHLFQFCPEALVIAGSNGKWGCLGRHG